MKNTALALLLLVSFSGFAQSMFGKHPYKNQQDFDEQTVHYGYFIGFSSYDFKINYNDSYYKLNDSKEILVTSNTGFNVGLVGNLRLIEHLDLRFEPGLYYTKRQLYFPAVKQENQNIRDVNSTYIHFPLLLKFSALRTGNIRPYLIGGISEALNLSSNETSKEDNYEGRFRIKKWTTNYELGFGIDFYFPHFKFTPSVRGVFGLQDELIRDYNEHSPWTGNIESIKTRAIFVNFTFH